MVLNNVLKNALKIYLFMILQNNVMKNVLKKNLIINLIHMNVEKMKIIVIQIRLIIIQKNVYLLVHLEKY